MGPQKAHTINPGALEVLVTLFFLRYRPEKLATF